MEPLKPGSNTKAGGPAGSEPHPSNKPVSGGSTGSDLHPSDKLAQGDHDQEGEADKFGRGRTTRGRLAAGSLGAPRPTSPPPTAVQERPTLSYEPKREGKGVGRSEGAAERTQSAPAVDAREERRQRYEANRAASLAKKDEEREARAAQKAAAKRLQEATATKVPAHSSADAREGRGQENLLELHETVGGGDVSRGPTKPEEFRIASPGKSESDATSGSGRIREASRGALRLGAAAVRTAGTLAYAAWTASREVQVRPMLTPTGSRSRSPAPSRGSSYPREFGSPPSGASRLVPPSPDGAEKPAVENTPHPEPLQQPSSDANAATAAATPQLETIAAKAEAVYQPQVEEELEAALTGIAEAPGGAGVFSDGEPGSAQATGQPALSTELQQPPVLQAAAVAQQQAAPPAAPDTVQPTEAVVQQQQVVTEPSNVAAAVEPLPEAQAVQPTVQPAVQPAATLATPAAEQSAMHAAAAAVNSAQQASPAPPAVAQPLQQAQSQPLPKASAKQAAQPKVQPAVQPAAATVTPAAEQGGTQSAAAAAHSAQQASPAQPAVAQLEQQGQLLPVLPAQAQPGAQPAQAPQATVAQAALGDGAALLRFKEELRDRDDAVLKQLQEQQSAVIAMMQAAEKRAAAVEVAMQRQAELHQEQVAALTEALKARSTSSRSSKSSRIRRVGRIDGREVESVVVGDSDYAPTEEDPGKTGDEQTAADGATRVSWSDKSKSESGSSSSSSSSDKASASAASYISAAKRALEASKEANDVAKDVQARMKNELSSAKAPKASRSESLTELPRALKSLGKMTLKQGMAEFREFERANMDTVRSFAPDQRTAMTWWRYVRRMVFKLLSERRDLKDTVARSKWRTKKKHLTMPNQAMQYIEESRLGGAVRRALPSAPHDSSLRLWKQSARKFWKEDEDDCVTESTIELLLFSLAPLFDDNDDQIGELLEITSWCNPPDKIADIPERLEKWKDDLEMRADLWPSEPYPAVVDFRKVLVNFRKVLHRSLDTAAIRIHEKIVKKEVRLCIERCDDATILYGYLIFLADITIGLKSCTDKCAIDAASMKRTRSSGLLNSVGSAKSGKNEAGEDKDVKKKRKGKKARVIEEEVDDNAGSASVGKSYEELAQLNQTLSKIVCPAFQKGKCCPMADFCPMDHGVEAANGVRKVNGEERCVCGQPLAVCTPANHRKVVRPEGKKYTVWRKGEKKEREFLYGGLKSAEMRRGLTEDQKKHVASRDKILVEKKAFHALPPYHKQSTRQTGGGKSSGKGGNKEEDKTTKSAAEEKKSREKEKRAAKKAEIAELVKLGRAAKASTSAAAVPEPKAVPTPRDRDRAHISEAHRQAAEGMGGALKDASGQAKAGKSTTDEPSMLSDSGCFRFAAPLGATKAEPNRSAKVQPIDGDPLTVPSIEAGGEQVLLLGDELVCSENRAVQRMHKNGMRFIVHRANGGTQFAELDELGEDRVRKVIAEEAARSGGKVIHLSRRNGCDYVDGEDVAYVWNASQLPRLKKGAPLTEPDERARRHATGIAQRARNPNMHERYEHAKSALSWGRVVVLALAVACGGSESSSVAADAMRTGPFMASTRSRPGRPRCREGDGNDAGGPAGDGLPTSDVLAQASKRRPRREHPREAVQVVVEQATTAEDALLCCCCGRLKHLMVRCEEPACNHALCGSCWSNQGGMCPQSHHRGVTTAGGPLGLQCLTEEDIPNTSDKAVKVCCLCNVEEASSESARVCQGCEQHVLGIIGYSAIAEGVMAAVGDYFGTKRAQWTKRWMRAASHQYPLGTSVSIDVVGRRDDNFDYVYKSKEDTDRLAALLGRTQPYKQELWMLWCRCQKECSCLYDTVSMFEAMLNSVPVAPDEENVSFGDSGGTAAKARPSAVVDHCAVHGVYDAACETCRQVYQKLAVKYRGTSSLLRGRWLGVLVIYADLKDGLPRSERGNLYLLVATVYLEASWDADRACWKYTHKLSIDVALRNKDERNLCYGIKVVLTEARITRTDTWFLHFDNESAVAAQATLGMIVCHGGDLLNSIPRLHDTTAETGVRLSLLRGSHGVRKSNLGPLCWDDSHESTSLWESEDRGVPGWSRFYNTVPRFRLGVKGSVKLPPGTPGRQEYPVGAQDCALRGFVRRTARGVRIFYRDANDTTRLRSTVVSYDWIELKDELAFDKGQVPGALKEPWPELGKVDAMMDRDPVTNQPYFVPCVRCGIYRSTTRATYCDWDAGKLEEKCEAYLKNQVLPEFWSCWEPTEDFVDEGLDWRQPTAESKAAEKVILLTDDRYRGTGDVAAPLEVGALGAEEPPAAPAEPPAPSPVPAPVAVRGRGPAAEVAPVASEDDGDVADPFAGYNPAHSPAEWTQGDRNKLADLKARRLHTTPADLKMWWRRMKMADFLPLYHSVEPKLMYKLGNGEEPSPPPIYVPFDLARLDKEKYTVEAADASTCAGSDSDVGSDWDDDNEVANAAEKVDEETPSVKAMTKAQRMKWKRQQRRRRINISKFKESINDREDLLGPDDTKDKVVVCELEDLKGSLAKLDAIINALGYLPTPGEITEEEADAIEAAGVCKVTKTVQPRELGKYGLQHKEQAAREKEASTMREFGVFGIPVADDDNVRGLPGFNYADVISACAIKDYETDDPDVRFRAVYNGSDSRIADESKAVFQTIRDIPASLMEIRIVLVICRLMNFIVKQGDVVGAYLNATAPKNSFVRLGKEWLSALSKEGQQEYLRLMKEGKRILVPLLMALYGHVLSGALWSQWFADKLKEMGWKQLRDVSDAVWVIFDEAGRLAGILAVYVDDMIVGATDKVLSWFESKLTELVRLKAGLHDVGRLLGGLYRSRRWTEQVDDSIEEHEEIFISVGQYADHIARRYFGTKAADSPFAAPGRFATPADPDSSAAAVPGTVEAGVHGDEAAIHIGGSMWLQRVGLPNLCTSTNALAREVQSWSSSADKALYRHMSWIKKHAIYLGLLLYVVSGIDDLTLLIKTDADHGTSPRTRLSITGFHIFLISPRGTFALLDWASARQRAVAISTAEAELAALQAALKRALEILMILRLAGLKVRVLLCCDSTAAIAIANTGISPKIRYASVTQGISAEWIAYVCRLLGAPPSKVDTVLNSADLQTKGLSKGPFWLHSRFIGIMDENEWQDTRRCEGRHQSPVGEVRCKSRSFGPLCDYCAAQRVCPCWYGVTAWDERFKDKIALQV